ncbi:hypothetical protein E2P63_01200 [Candidatus Bathyarchaeota archaeon]|nr:hypothetical protein E2P63_01200 [Candidatus Bathyarchaeota archaeon]
MARSDIQTILSLDQFAAIWGLNPLHFNGARLPQSTDGVEPYTTTYPYQSQTQTQPGLNHRPIWHQYNWQDGSSMSREDVAQQIAVAERDIADFIGYWPAPVWIAQEVHKYPEPYRREYFGIGKDVRWQSKGIKTKYAKVIQAGRRSTTLIDTATVAGGELVYSDPSSLGFNSLATITVATTLTNECEIKLYFTDKSGVPTWEIRPLKSVSISGGFVTITLDSWLLFDPDLVEAVPMSEITAIDANDSDSYVTSVEVRREYTDFTQASAQLIWERQPAETWPQVFSCTSCGGTGCEVCSMISQDACVTIKNAENGFLGPAVAATYDSDDERWEKTSPTQCREPDQVKVWYYCGDYSQPWLRGETCNPLDNTMARMIATLAMSRLQSTPDTSGGLSEILEYWHRDTAETLEGSTVFTPPDVLANPFGTRRGEVMVYKTLSKMRERKLQISAVAA